MSVFWNEGISDTNAGLDILGVRIADQSHEARLTGGITTISQRARYLSLLPWFLHEWYRRALDGGTARHDRDAQLAALRRLERVVLFSTVVSDANGEVGDARGVLGSDLWAADVAELQAGGEVDLSSTKGGASLGTYAQPCIQLRLLQDGTPVAIPCAGRELAEARRAALRDAPVVDRIFSGGTMDRVSALVVAPHFSVNGLGAPESTRERDLLAGVVTSTTSSLGLGTTILWTLEAAGTPVGASTLIAGSFRAASVVGSELGGVALEYARYELHRRVHFALELCIQAISTELRETESRSVRTIARLFARAAQATLVDVGVFVKALPLADVTVQDFAANLRGPALMEPPLVNEARRSFPPASQAAYAMALLLTTVNAARANAHLMPPEEGAARRAMAIVEAAQSRGTQEVLEELLAFVVERHLLTTFRKMAAGQPCSLRFVADRGRLRTTDQVTRAGMSGHRLANVMVILSDLGFLTRGSDGFVITERGRTLLGEVVS